MKFHYYLLLLPFLLLSCKKDKKEVKPANAVTVTIDGVAKTFNEDAKASHNNGPDGETATLVEGYTSDGEAIMLAINGTPAAGKTYTSDELLIGYAEINGNYTFAYEGTITVNQVSATSISGTFNGTIHYPDRVNPTPIKNGKFNVSF